MRQSGTPTKYPGVYIIGKREYRVRGTWIDPRTGKQKEVDRLVQGVSARQAAKTRAELLDRARAEATPTTRRRRVGEFARSWMRSKALKLDSGTARTYADALEQHVLPRFGDFYYDAVTSQDVQRWVDDALVSQWTTKDGKRRFYSRNTVHGWFRVFRTMTRDAMVELGLERDPTMRISFPEQVDHGAANTLSPEELARFLDAMRERFPQHFALVVLLAFTGLRFCHACALKWDDWDEVAGVIRVVRKHSRGKVGPVTRKKRAPREYPVEPELAEVLRWQRDQLAATKAPGVESGWMFPTRVGTLRAPSSLDKAWKRCLVAVGVDHRFTVHGMRYTFSDLTRLAKIDPIVRRALTGHVTEQMQRHYSNVGLDEKRSAVAGAIRLIPTKFGRQTGDRTGDSPSETTVPADQDSSSC